VADFVERRRDSGLPRPPEVGVVMLYKFIHKMGVVLRQYNDLQYAN